MNHAGAYVYLSRRRRRTRLRLALLGAYLVLVGAAAALLPGIGGRPW